MNCISDRQMNNLGTSHSALRDSQNVLSYNGTNYRDEFDTQFSPEDDIDTRFGASTRIGDGFSRRQDLDHTFSTGYQSTIGYKTRTEPPKGIFDDV